MADPHCSHRVGLTPPAWQLRSAEAEPKRMKYVHIQQECWNWFKKTIAALKPIDILFVMGDAIEGCGYRSGGTELITTDRNIQIDMALKCIKQANAKKIVMVRGTPYHTGFAEDREDLIASFLNCKIGDHEWVEVNGLIFDLKHHVGRSEVPHTRGTAIARDSIWNLIWASEEDQPKADILLRAHVHYHAYYGEARNGRPFLAATCPALQAMGSKFGAKRMSGRVDYGLLCFDTTPKGTYTWQAHIAKLVSQKAQALKL